MKEKENQIKAKETYLLQKIRNLEDQNSEEIYG